MPGLVGGFFRRGHSVDVYSTQICTDHLYSYRNGSRLNNAIKANEPWLWGIAKWGKNRDRFIKYFNTLPCLEIQLSSTKVNLYFKNGTATINLLSRMNSHKIGKKVSESVLSLISPKGKTITRENLIMYPGYKKPGNLQTKHGNLGHKLAFKKPFLLGFLILKTLILTYYTSKHSLDCSIQYGGKTAEKANAVSNSTDTRVQNKSFKSSGLLIINKNSRLQNSVSLIKVSGITSDRKYSTLDLSKESRSEFSITYLKSYDPIKGQEIVESKQMELMRLAENVGLHDHKVFDLQLVLARSFAFRAHASWLILSQTGTSSPVLDNEIINKENKAEMFKTLIEYLRDMIYHPKRYKPTALKLVFKPKAVKTDNKPIGIATIKDRALQSLVNLVLYPLVKLTSDPNNYGFRVHQDCKLAIAAVKSNLRTINFKKARNSMNLRYSNYKAGQFNQVNESLNKWILDANIIGFYDNIYHEWLCNNLFLHPTLIAMVKQWIKAGILDAGIYSDPINGTSQGGIISPTLRNFTLNGIEERVLKSIYPINNGYSRKQIKVKGLIEGRTTAQAMSVKMDVSIVRYVDDFVVIAKSKNILNKYVTPAITDFLKERGLCLSAHKTKTFTLAHKNTQLDFLGYTFKISTKRFLNKTTKRTMVWEDSVNVIVLFPNKDKVRKFIKKLKEIINNSQNLSAIELITKLNPMIREWALYYNLDNSSHYRSVVKNALYNLIWRWMRRKHPTLGKNKLAQMYLLRPFDAEIVPNYTNPENDGYYKFKNRKMTFFGVFKTNNRDTKVKDSKRIVYLANPETSARLIRASKYILPKV